MDNLNNQSPVWNWQNNGDIQYITMPEWNGQGVKIGFSTRTGGCSQAPYESLNLGLHVGDECDRVIANRQALVDTFSCSLDQMICCQQVHGNEIARVDSSLAGRGSAVYATALPGYDAMICNTPGLLLATFYADCFPVFLFDPKSRAVGIAHCGWKGVMGRLAAKTVEEMTAAFGCRPENMQVLIGPGIQSCCFQVQGDLAQRVNHEFAGLTDLVCQDEYGFHWDLPKTIRETLVNQGIRSQNLITCDLCTACNPELFFSYRRNQGITGRMAALIGID